MSMIDREKLEKQIDEMIELSKSYSDQSDWDKGYRRALNDLKREIQSGEFGLRETEPQTLKPGDRVRHKSHDRYGIGEVVTVSKTGKRVEVKFPRIRGLLLGHQAYFPVESLEKVEEPNYE